LEGGRLGIYKENSIPVFSYTRHKPDVTRQGHLAWGIPRAPPIYKRLLMHILFLTQVLPFPLDAGPKIRAYYTLRYLTEHHRVTLLSFVRDTDQPQAIDHLRSFCEAVHTVPMTRSRVMDGWHLLRSLPTSVPTLIARDERRAMKRKVEEVLGSHPPFDVVHADQLWMAPYALHGRRVKGNSAQPRLVLDQHNAVFQIPQRLAQHEPNPLKRAVLALEAHKLVRYEKNICRQFDEVVWVTEEDRVALDLQGESTASELPHSSSLQPPRSSVIPICVDVEAQTLIPRRPDAYRVTFLGGLHWPPNAEGILWLATHIWPEVSKRLPEACLTIIGKSPPRSLLKMSSSSVEITGYVDNPVPYLEETAVFVVPLQAGGGMRVKIVEAWSRGLPIVSTPIGAEGVLTKHGENILLASSDNTFAEAVVSIFQQPDLASRLATGGRATAERRYDWRTSYQAWDEVYGRIPLLTTRQPADIYVE
jgi:glycosyltransferase involved in cell wall biosynthesis